MKSNKLIVAFLTLCMACSCSLTHRLEKSNPRANITLPSLLKQDTASRNLPKMIEFSDKDGNRQIVMQAVKDSVTGQEVLTVNLNEITVVAKSKSVPERKGKVSIDFIVNVPEILIHKNLQLSLTPNLLISAEKQQFDELVITGMEFDRKRERGYQKYSKYLAAIVPDSLFADRFVNKQGYAGFLRKYDRKENKRILKDSLSWQRNSLFRSGVQARYDLFNGILHRRRTWLGNILGFNDIKKRYEVFGQDTTHISHFYAGRFETWVRLLPQYHLIRQMEKRFMPERYRKERFNYPFERDYRFLTSEDSLQILQKYLHTKLISRNNRRIAGKEKMYDRWVVFPKNANARLDTVIHSKGVFEYHYHEELDADESSKRMQVYLSGTALTKNGCSYVLAHSDTLSYVVSSMIQFLDLTPRFQRKIIERKVAASLKAYVTFPVGKSMLEENLGENRAELEKIREMVQKLTGTGELVMDSIVLGATSSPEGSYQSNLLLSKLRAQAIKKFVSGRLTDMENIDTMVVTHTRGEDWEGLLNLVKQSEKIAGKKRILELITSAVHPDKREAEIRRLFPADYRIMQKELYPLLRAVDFTFHMHRSGMVKDTIHTSVPDTLYALAIEMMKERKYNKALTILGEYNDWNTAICLMSLGYDEGAFNLLVKEKCTADSQYLLSILCSRMGKEKEAVERYLDACRMDDSKRWRGALDPEIHRLIKAYSLNKEPEN